MTDPRPDAQSAVNRSNGTVTWDLTAPEVAFPIQVEMAAKTYEVYGVLRQPYDADDLIEAINRNRGGYRRTAATLENIAGDDQAFAALTDKLFLRLEGTSSNDPAVQRKFLDSNFKLKIRLAREGLGGIFIDRNAVAMPAEESEKFDLLPLAMDVTSDIVIPVHQELWDPATQKKIDIKMQHILRPETEHDWRRWARTSTERFLKASNQWTEGIQWYPRIELYDHMVRRLDGLSVGSHPCLESNKDE